MQRMYYDAGANGIFMSVFKTLSSVVGLFILSLSWSNQSIAQEEIIDDNGNSRYIQTKLSVSDIRDQVQQSFLNAINLPLPFGDVNFLLTENNALSKELKLSNPNLRTYDIISVDGQYSGKLTVSASNIFALIDSPDGDIIIRPISNEADNLYESYFTELESQIIGTPQGDCEIIDRNKNGLRSGNQDNAASSRGPGASGFNYGTIRRTYRVAIVTTNEFGNEHGANAMTIIATTIQAMNTIYEKDMSVSFTLTNTEIHSSTNLSTPYLVTTDQNSGDSRTNQAAEAVGGHFASSTYDIGHVFHFYPSADNNNNDMIDATEPPNWSGGGVAGLGVVCDESTSRTIGDSDAFTGPNKAAGWSGSFDNTSNGWFQLVAHEIGHMFGANHTFNGTGASCTAAIAATNAYEIASGNSIMSYNGICSASYNIPSGGASDNYFHTASIDEMITYINGTGGTCGTTSGSNNAPVVNADPCSAGTVTIPRGTPFCLTGSATDADGGTLTYVWEQVDEDGAGSPTQGATLTQGSTTAGNSTTAPLFRSFPPSASGNKRTFPSTIDGSSTGTEFEVLPQVARSMNFALTVRDCQGGVACVNRAITVANAGPLTISSACGTVAAGNTTTITLGGTSGVTCGSAKVYMSIDGGNTFPYDLGTVAYSDGAKTVTIPSTVVATTTARFKVVCEDNPCAEFFQITSSNCTITSNCQAAANVICPVDAMTLAQGAAGLNLSLGMSFATQLPSYSNSFTVNDSDPIAPAAIANSSGGSTCMTMGSRRYESFTFSTDASGNYTLSESGSTFIIMTVFEAAGFNTASPCSSTFLGSSGFPDSTPGFTSASSSVTVNLTACTEYIVMLYGSSSGSINTISVSGAGNINLTQTSPSSDYAYTYVAVNTANNQVVAQSATSDFSSLTAGTYQICGLSYKASGATPPANVTPSSLIGQTVSNILSNNCVLFSTNKKSLIVTSDCAITAIATSNLSACSYSSGNSTFTADVTVTFANRPSTGNLVLSGDGSGTVAVASTTSTTSHTFTGVSMTADGGAINLVATFSAETTCTFTNANAGTAPAACPPATCDITSAGLTSIACNNNSTTSNTADDFITFSLNPTGNNLGSSYNVSVSSGTVSPTSGNYGSATNFQLQNGSAGSGNVTVTITDATTGTCTEQVVITDPGTCSGACDITSAGLTSVACNNNSSASDATDDIITFSLNPTGNNLGSSYNVSVSSGTVSPTSGNYGSATNFQLQSGSAGSGNVTVTITDATTGTCTEQVVITDPGSCSNTCTISAIAITNVSACSFSGGNSTFTADVTVTFANRPSTGNLVLSGDGSGTVAVGSTTNATSHTFTGVSMTADGAAINLTATFSAETTCTFTNANAGTAPNACSPICAISAITMANASVCNDNGTASDATDDTFTADIIVNFVNAPSTGTLNVTGAVSTSVAVGSLSSATSHTFTGVTMPADGSVISLTAAFSANTSCTFTNANVGTAPFQCSVTFTAPIVTNPNSPNNGMFMADDPCSCNGDQILNTDGSVATAGTFSETVTVNGPANLVVRISNNAGNTGILDPATKAAMALPIILTETPAGSGTYQVTFFHRDRVGYNIAEFEFASTAAGPFSVVTGGSPSFTPITISNVCAYPQVVFTPALAGMVDAAANPINLGANLVSTITPVVSYTPLAGQPTFTVNGTVATVFDPNRAPAQLGLNTIVATHDFQAGTGEGGTIAVPAIPLDPDNSPRNGVCPVSIQATIAVGTNIPTMSQWGLIIFGLLVINLSVLFIKRKEKILK